MVVLLLGRDEVAPLLLLKAVPPPPPPLLLLKYCPPPPPPLLLLKAVPLPPPPLLLLKYWLSLRPAAEAAHVSSGSQHEHDLSVGVRTRTAPLYHSGSTQELLRIWNHINYLASSTAKQKHDQMWLQRVPTFLHVRLSSKEKLLGLGLTHVPV